jgi:hypothetical protein
VPSDYHFQHTSHSHSFGQHHVVTGHRFFPMTGEKRRFWKLLRLVRHRG